MITALVRMIKEKKAKAKTKRIILSHARRPKKYVMTVDQIGHDDYVLFIQFVDILITNKRIYRLQKYKRKFATTKPNVGDALWVAVKSGMF